ncbi:winged helix-turn-helix domain-containing protein [Streptomyces sp. NBC_00144]|uniref:AfsR/SARP family transcriptional regulator n=1 Tax=Streptomyces sp. NBC_00144 TaxID=2975665 RepID=UPI00324FE262
MRFELLGPLRAWRDSNELELGPPKQRALLALLLVRAGRPVDMPEIVDALWGEQPPKSATNVVHRHVGGLRKTLAGDPPNGGTGSEILRSSTTYRLPVDASSLDLLRFRELTANARQAYAGGAPEAAVELLVQALALRSGQVATGIPAEVQALPAFAAVDREYLDAVTTAADIALEADAAGRLRIPLQQAAEQNPLEEELQARLISVLARTGRQAEALELYRQVRRRLADQLGIDPGPALRQAHAQVLRGRTSPGARTSARAPGARTGPLVDSARRDRLRVSMSAPAAQPTPVPVVRPHQLPALTGGFTGRQPEIDSVLALVPDVPGAGRPASVVISAISGMAGVGKTSLALHLAHRIAHRYPDGQLYVDLRGFAPADLVSTAGEALRSFLHALGVPARRVPVGVDEQTALYRSLLAERRILIVLDNARSPQHVRPLLPGGSDSLVIVTSRSFLQSLVATEGAHPLVLGPLSADEAREALVRRLGGRRVMDEPEATDTIIRLCGSLPLALAVVAARAATRPGLPLASVAAELGGRRINLDALTDADPRTDIRSVFSWSCDNLSAEAAQLFRLLPVHPGPSFSVLAAANLAGLPVGKTGELLAELVRAHLLNGTATHRYGFHDLVHAYADELSRGDDATARHAARRRMAGFYLHSARSAATTLDPHRIEHIDLAPPQPGTTLEPIGQRERAAAWLDTELPVLLLLVEQTACGDLPLHTWQLAQTLDLYLDRRGRRQDQLGIQRIALDVAERTGDRLGQAHAHCALGLGHARLAGEEEAQLHLRRALALFTELGEDDGRARTHRLLAFRANAGDDHDLALHHYQQALALYRSTRHLSGQASVFNETGRTYSLLGRHDLSLLLCRRAITMHHRIGDMNGEAAAWDSLGFAQHGLGRFSDALDSFRRALHTYESVNDLSLQAGTLIHIGDALDAQGNGSGAAEAWERALTILTRLGHPDAEQLRDKLCGRPG